MAIPSEITRELLALLPEKQASALLMLSMDKTVSSERMETAISELLEDIDLSVWQQLIGKFLNQIMPVEQLVPKVYAAWRPIVRDALIFIGGHLSTKRLIPKLIEQIRLPTDLPLERRFITFISQMPSLQKLGQIIARNRNLAPNFRTELMRLENEISDVTPFQVRTLIEQQLAPVLEKYQVKLEETIHAEASVSAVMRFSWLNRKASKREQGVFKVLKPFIHDNFVEEMILLQGLADFFDTSHSEHILTEVNVRKIFDDIRILLEQEINFINEQANLEAASRRYRVVAGVRVPQLIQELSTPSITAMTAEIGRKVTDAFSNHPLNRIKLATRIIEALVAIPLFSSDEEAVFHADPHAGNLFVDEKTRELIIFDWALTDKLERKERRHIILLVSVLMLRDTQLIFNALAALSKDNLIEDEIKAEKVHDQITCFLNELSIFRLPSVMHILTLLDDVMLTGISFSAPLLMFRKVLLTLDGVLYNVSAMVPFETVLAQYVVKEKVKNMYGLNFLQPGSVNFQFPLTSDDRLSLIWSTQWYGIRTGMQLGEQIGKRGLKMLQD